MKRILSGIFVALFALTGSATTTLRWTWQRQ